VVFGSEKKGNRFINTLTSRMSRDERDYKNFDEGWAQMKEMMDVLESEQDFSMKSSIPAYTICFNMCNQQIQQHSYHAELYTKHGDMIRDYLEREVLPAIQDKGSPGVVPLLEDLKFSWENYTIINNWYCKIFRYLERSYIRRNKLPSLSQAGLTVFKLDIFDHLKVVASDAIVEFIDNERGGEGEIIKKDLILNTIQIFEAMGMDTLESKLLESTREYYAKKREEWTAANSTVVYFINAEQAFTEESNRFNKYFNSETKSKLFKAVQEELGYFKNIND
jgi:cullin 1